MRTRKFASEINWPLVAAHNELKRSIFIKMKQKLLNQFLCFVYMRCEKLAKCDFVYLYEDGTKLMMFSFFVSVKLLHNKSMNNFKTHKLLKNKRPEIFYVFYSRCLLMSVHKLYRIKRWTKMLEFTYGTVPLNQSHIGWLCKWTIKIELRYDLNTMLASIFHRNLSRQV